MTDGHWERAAERYPTSRIADLHALGSSGPSDATRDAGRSRPTKPRGLSQLIRVPVLSSQFKTLSLTFLTASGPAAARPACG